MSASPIEVESSSASVLCPRCGKEGLLSARVPHGWTNESGAEVTGHTVVVLCSACDADSPSAAPLITWLHVHGSVSIDTADQFVGLVVRWARDLEPPVLDEAALAAEIEAWRCGEL